VEAGRRKLVDVWSAPTNSPRVEVEWWTTIRYSSKQQIALTNESVVTAYGISVKAVTTHVIICYCQLLSLKSPLPSPQAMAVPPYGVYTPLVTYFNEDETVDLYTVAQHALRMAQGGIAGLVLQGSNGEAPHLLHDERQKLISHVRKTLDDNSYSRIVLIVGCAAASVFESLLHIKEAQQSGADFALILPPSYWTAAMNPAVIERFFSDVSCPALCELTSSHAHFDQIAEESPLPILIYNFPAVTGGIDISSDLISSLAVKHPDKVVGAKLTCGNVGKLQRLAHPASPRPFAVFAGKSDFFLPALVAGSNGVIAALANIAPKAHVKILELYAAGDMKAAIELQTKLSHADWNLSKVGVAGVKAVITEFYGYGTGRSRRPLGSFDISTLSTAAKDSISAVVDIEKGL